MTHKTTAAQSPAATHSTPTACLLAGLLGVAASTIRRAFDEQSRISSERRARILAKADELGYRPNAIARSLNRSRTGTVAWVVGDMANPFTTAGSTPWSMAGCLCRTCSTSSSAQPRSPTWCAPACGWQAWGLRACAMTSACSPTTPTKRRPRGISSMSTSIV